MPKALRISAAEWEVMNQVWEQSPIAAAQIVEHLSRRRDWTSRTIRTLIARLVGKRAVRSKMQGRRYLYWPAVDREHCVRQESRSFVERVFGGAPASMVLHLVRQTKLSPDEIRELRRILEEKER
jgi:BlaI family penicillinase repressor